MPITSLVEGSDLGGVIFLKLKNPMLPSDILTITAQSKGRNTGMRRTTHIPIIRPDLASNNIRQQMRQVLDQKKTYHVVKDKIENRIIISVGNARY